MTYIPGPYTLDKSYEDDWYHLDAPSHGHFAKCVVQMTNPTLVGTATLLQHAPDLYDALRELTALSAPLAHQHPAHKHAMRLLEKLK